MPKNDPRKKSKHPVGLSYQDILERAAARGDTMAQEELKWRENKRRKTLTSPHRSYKTGFKRGFY